MTAPQSGEIDQQRSVRIDPPQDCGRGREYRLGDWWVRIFGPDCGVLMTPAVLDHRLYLRWSVRSAESLGWGVWAGRDEDDVPTLDLRAGRLMAVEIVLPEYRRSEEVNHGG